MVLGCLCYAKISHEANKFKSRKIPTIVMGYLETQNGYILLDLTNYFFFVNRDITFKENIFPFKK